MGRDKPPGNVIVEFIIQHNLIVQHVGLLCNVNHPVEVGLALVVDTADEFQLTYER